MKHILLVLISLLSLRATAGNTPQPQLRSRNMVVMGKIDTLKKINEMLGLAVEATKSRALLMEEAMCSLDSMLSTVDSTKETTPAEDIQIKIRIFNALLERKTYEATAPSLIPMINSYPALSQMMTNAIAEAVSTNGSDRPLQSEWKATQLFLNENTARIRSEIEMIQIIERISYEAGLSNDFKIDAINRTNKLFEECSR